MATPIASGDASATALFALTALEEQLVFICQRLVAAQNAYNTANPNAQKNAVSLSPDFTNSTITLQAILPLTSDAVTSFSAAKVSGVFTGV